MVYILLLIELILITILFKIFKVDVKKNKTYLFIMFLILTLFLALRGENVGLDMMNYKEFFVSARNYSFGFLVNNINFEIGFKMLTKFITLFTNNFRVYIFIISFLSMIGSYYFIRNNSKNYFASVYIFITFNYYIYSFCTLRQALAISILLIGFNFIKKEKYLTFILITLFACLFHKTSIVFLLLCLIKWFPYFKKYLIQYLIICFAFVFIKDPLIEFFTKMVYSQYIGYHDMSGNGYIMLLFIFLITIFFGFINKKVCLEKKENNIYMLMMLLSIPLQILSTTQGLIARMVLYLSYSFIIIIPEYLESLEKNKKIIFKVIYYSLLMLFFILEVYTNSMYVPYTVF